MNTFRTQKFSYYVNKEVALLRGLVFVKIPSSLHPFKHKTHTFTQDRDTLSYLLHVRYVRSWG